MIYDELTNYAGRPKAIFQKDFFEWGVRLLKKYLPNAVPINIENVAKYYFDSYSPGVDVEDITPNKEPPWPSFLMEFKGPESQGSVATLFIAYDNSSLKDISIHHDEYTIRSPRWLYVAMALWRKGAEWGSPFSTIFGIDGESRFSKLTGSTCDQIGESFHRVDGNILSSFPSCSDIEIENLRKVFGCDDIAHLSQYLFNLMVGPCLLAVSFCHCKNVKIVDNHPALPRAARRRGDRPKVVYKTLSIEPMKKVLATEGQSAALGLKHALHVCRGHFKHYSGDKKLFGKHEGMFWWDMHARGNPESGEVIKSYAVQPTDKEE